MQWMIVFCSLVNLVTGPILYYDKTKYDYEDSLIRGESILNRRTGEQTNRLNRQQLDVPVLAQALNFRLPHIPTRRPSLQENINKNITTFTGSTVVLPCRVLHLGTATVSWIRRPELAVLSHGDILFSSSSRLRILHSSGSVDWNLQIEEVKSIDSGTYECQVNTEPKESRLVHLRVVEEPEVDPDRPNLHVPALALQAEVVEERVQKTEILAPPEVRVPEGGSVTLECVVTEHRTPPSSFTWFIGERALDFHVHRGGILLEEERKTRSSASKLTLTRMEVGESAVYTCSPAGADSASVRVTVFTETANRRFTLSGVKSVNVEFVLLAVSLGLAVSAA